MVATKKEKLLKDLGEKIKIIRIKKGLSQSELANVIGKDQPSINRLERGNINPSYYYLFEIAEGLGVKVYELFKLEEE